MRNRASNIDPRRTLCDASPHTIRTLQKEKEKRRELPAVLSCMTATKSAVCGPKTIPTRELVEEFLSSREK